MAQNPPAPAPKAKRKLRLRSYVPPQRRQLKIYAFDPMLGRAPLNRITIDVRNERVKFGPVGSQVAVIDYDGANKIFYQPINLEARNVLSQDGLDPSESAPRFHQQMVYAVAMKVIENVEQALGRHLRFRGPGGRLRIFPHALQDANAFYDPETVALYFGYFRADRANPGQNLPGQTIFTCLSHDIIAHETTHAIVDRLRKHFGVATNRDVLAFHEGFADIVAIFQHFTFREILRDTVQKTHADLSSPNEMLKLAEQFGHATAMNDALRNAYGDRDKPPNTLYSSVWEPHERGSILVAAIFEAFFETYQRRIRDLVRIASGGTGRLPEGDLHPDLVNRIADEAGKTAQYVLAMCVRAFEHLPPVDIAFGDYLRALVTADREQFPADEKRQREFTIEAFRRRGIFPDDVYSLAEDSLRWPLVSEAGMRIEPLPDAPIDELLQDEARTYGAFRRQARTSDGERILRSWKAALTNNAMVNSKNFLLDPRLPIEAEGFHATHRTLADGQLRIEIVAQFTQKYVPANNAEREALGGLDVRGGTTVVASADGEVRYVIPKPVPSALPGVGKRQQAVERLVAWVERCDERDPRLPWEGPAYVRQRMAGRINFAAAHRGLTRVPR